MSRIRLFHWKDEEAVPLVEGLRAAGHQVDYPGSKIVSSSKASLRRSPPDAIVIDLNRLPSHGREVAKAVRGTK